MDSKSIFRRSLAGWFFSPRKRPVCKTFLRHRFEKRVQKRHFVRFWLKRRAEYGLTSDRALKFLIPFSTSYLCETGFSAMLAVKNKYRSKLELEPDLRLKLTYIRPDILNLCLSKQAQSSHWLACSECNSYIMILHSFLLMLLKWTIIQGIIIFSCLVDFLVTFAGGTPAFDFFPGGTIKVKVENPCSRVYS